MYSLILFPLTVLCFVFPFFVFTHSSLIVSDSYSSLFAPAFQPISARASHQQIRSHFSVPLDIPLSTLVARPSFLSYSLNLKYLLQSTLSKSLLCPSEFYSGRILLKPTALRVDCSLRERVSLFSLTHIVSAPACSSSHPQLH